MKFPYALQRPFKHEHGNCWRAKLPDDMVWATDNNTRHDISPLHLLEGETSLTPKHASHRKISEVGRGCNSFWHDGWVYFSASDNSNPNDNGRTYSIDLARYGSELEMNSANSDAAMLATAILRHNTSISPSQIWQLVSQVLGKGLPSWVFDFNRATLQQELEDVDLVIRRYKEYLVQLETADTVFLSIMCSGRTWVRYFLQTYIGSATGESISLAPQAIPATSISPSVLFMHDFLGMFETIAAEPFVAYPEQLNAKPLILLVRDVRDLAVSWFHYLRRSQPDAFKRLVPAQTLEAFIESPILGIERLAKVQLVQADFFAAHPGPKILLNYEKLHERGHDEFQSLLKFVLSSDINQQAFEQAFEQSSFQEMQALEIAISRAGKAQEYLRLGVDNWSGDINDLKVRTGKTGRFKDVLPFLDDCEIMKNRYPLTAAALAVHCVK